MTDHLRELRSLVRRRVDGRSTAEVRGWIAIVRRARIMAERERRRAEADLGPVEARVRRWVLWVERLDRFERRCRAYVEGSR